MVPPVLVFQMGKVGSSSLEATLNGIWKGFVVHAHIEKDIPQRVINLVRIRRALRLPTYLICPIREPLSRNVSAFFQNWKRDTGIEYKIKAWSIEEVTELFLNGCRHNVFIEFFEKTFRPFTGIDVFDEDFPIERKWKVYRKNGLKALVYRSDLPRSSQLEIVSDFLSLHPPLKAFIEKNISEQKEYSATYNRFKEHGFLPEVYLRIMCESRTCKHFWSKTEIEAFKANWRANKANAADVKNRAAD